MSMVEVLQDLIAYCQEPPPPLASETHAIGFHLDPAESAPPYSYNGTLFFRPRPGSSSWFLHGFGYVSTPREGVPLPIAGLVRIGVQVGRHPVIETSLDFCDMNNSGGPGSVVRSVDCNASAQNFLGSIGMAFDPDPGTLGIGGVHICSRPMLCTAFGPDP